MFRCLLGLLLILPSGPSCAALAKGGGRPGSSRGATPRALGAPSLPPLGLHHVHGQGSPGLKSETPASQDLRFPQPAIEPAAAGPLAPRSSRIGLEAPALSTPRGGKSGESAAGPAPASPQPRSPDFTRQAWEHAQARGFVRFSSAESQDPGPRGISHLPAPGVSGAGAAQPEAPPAPAKGSGSPALLSRAVLGFFSAFSLVALVIEATAMVFSQMTDPVNTSFLRLAGLVSASFGAYAVGSFVGGRWVDRLGIARSYRWVLAARTAIWSLVALLFHRGGDTLALSVMLPLFCLDYFVHSVGRIAERKLQVAWWPDSPLASGRFGTAREFIEWGAVFLAGLTGLAIAKLGFGVVLYPVPLVLALATFMAFQLKDLPQSSAQKDEEVRLWDGLRQVLAAKPMLKPLLGMTLTNGVFFMLYYIVFTAFGSLITRVAETAAQISGSLGSLYGIGGALATGLLLLKAWAMERAVARRAPSTDKAQAEREAYARSASRSLVWAALGLLGAWLFVSQTPVGTVVWALFPVSPAIVLIALTGTVAFIHLETIMLDRIPADKKESHGGSILGAVRAILYASQIAGFLLCGVIFELLGPGGFWLFGLLCTGIAAVYLWLARDLRRAHTS